MGVLQQKRKWIRCGLIGRGCAFLARWMAYGALSVMQHNAAVSQPPGFSPAGLGTAIRRLRPPPGPTQAQSSPLPAPRTASTLSCCCGEMWHWEEQVT